jgi:hypothetical protein
VEASGTEFKPHTLLFANSTTQLFRIDISRWSIQSNDSLIFRLKCPRKAVQAPLDIILSCTRSR